MYSEGYSLKCKTNKEFLEKAFGIITKSQHNYEIDMGDYRFLIMPMKENKYYLPLIFETDSSCTSYKQCIHMVSNNVGYLQMLFFSKKVWSFI